MGAGGGFEGGCGPILHDRVKRHELWCIAANYRASSGKS